MGDLKAALGSINGIIPVIYPSQLERRIRGTPCNLHTTIAYRPPITTVYCRVGTQGRYAIVVGTGYSTGAPYNPPPHYYCVLDHFVITDAVRHAVIMGMGFLGRPRGGQNGNGPGNQRLLPTSRSGPPSRQEPRRLQCLPKAKKTGPWDDDPSYYWPSSLGGGPAPQEQGSTRAPPDNRPLRDTDIPELLRLQKLYDFTGLLTRRPPREGKGWLGEKGAGLAFPSQLPPWGGREEFHWVRKAPKAYHGYFTSTHPGWEDRPARAGTVAASSLGIRPRHHPPWRVCGCHAFTARFGGDIPPRIGWLETGQDDSASNRIWCDKRSSRQEGARLPWFERGRPPPFGLSFSTSFRQRRNGPGIESSSVTIVAASPSASGRGKKGKSKQRSAKRVQASSLSARALGSSTPQE
ncbi:hypothetical protein GGR53DRAFT_530517 [Hypoxylon sp. FL1150]|nr:hypothetical protein GGR53DRAFT_530517 [Hypoxylon sp. FL1150]